MMVNASKSVTVKEEYKKNPQLLRDEVLELMAWISGQQHLPKFTEFQAILFRQCCIDMDEAKLTIEYYMGARARWPEVFKNRDPLDLGRIFNVALMVPLPEKTPDGFSVLYCRLMDYDPTKYNFTEHMKALDMTVSLELRQNGTSLGHVLIGDVQNAGFGHLRKVSLSGIRKYMFYMQEALPVMTKGIHVLNCNLIVQKLIAMARPFFRKEVLEILHIHSTIDTLYQFVPKDILPTEYGGNAGSFQELHENCVGNIMSNREYFISEEAFLADEKARVVGYKRLDDIFGKPKLGDSNIGIIISNKS